MSGKRMKQIRRQVKKNQKKIIADFFKMVNEQPFSMRLKIAFSILKKRKTDK